MTAHKLATTSVARPIRIRQNNFFEITITGVGKSVFNLPFLDMGCQPYYGDKYLIITGLGYIP